MFAIDHAATALLIKRRYPSVAMTPLLLSVQAMELAWVGLNYLGVEKTKSAASFSRNRRSRAVSRRSSHSNRQCGVFSDRGSAPACRSSVFGTRGSPTLTRFETGGSVRES